jgi:spore coat polysaccharide biosynthesis protein SpsF (cytidylyltransferase family)
MKYIIMGNAGFGPNCKVIEAESLSQANKKAQEALRKEAVTGYKTPDAWELGVLYAVCRILEMTRNTTPAEDIIIQSGIKHLDLTGLDDEDKIQLAKLGSIMDSFLGL